MPAAFIQTTPTEYVPGGTGSYYDIDCSGIVPAGAVGIMVEVRNNGVGAKKYWCRVNGSGDDKYNYFVGSVMTTQFVGLDANCVIEVQVESTTQIDLSFRGYFTTPYVFLVDQQDMSTGTRGSYVDVDCSAYCPNAVAVLFHAPSGVVAYGSVRKNGSGDDFYATSKREYNYCVGEITGVDASVVAEQKVSSGDADLFITGYYAGTKITMHTNAIDRSTSTTDSYVDVGALPAGALYGVYSMYSQSADYATWLRENGSEDDGYSTSWSRTRNQGHGVWCIKCDTNRVIEQKIASTSADLYEAGYGIDESWQGEFVGISVPSEAVGLAGTVVSEVVGV